MTRANALRQHPSFAKRHPSLDRLDGRDSERPVAVHDVLAALVGRLSEVFELGEREHSLAYLVLFGRNPYTVAMALACSEAQATAEIAALFERCDVRSREQLFHLALRLANTPSTAANNAPLTPPPPARVTVRSRGWMQAAGRPGSTRSQERSRM